MLGLSVNNNVQISDISFKARNKKENNKKDLPKEETNKRNSWVTAAMCATAAVVAGIAIAKASKTGIHKSSPIEYSKKELKGFAKGKIKSMKEIFGKKRDMSTFELGTFNDGKIIRTFYSNTGRYVEQIESKNASLVRAYDKEGNLLDVGLYNSSSRRSITMTKLEGDELCSDMYLYRNTNNNSGIRTFIKYDSRTRRYSAKRMGSVIGSTNQQKLVEPNKVEVNGFA